MTEPRLPRDRYRLLGLLGRGGMATVWRVLDVRLGVERAVKLLPSGVLHEAQLAASLSHPNIVAVHDVLDVPEGTCVVLELAQGSLADHVAAHGPLAPSMAARLMADVCDALATAHAAGVVHRDVKPQNLLVFDAGRVKLADFGIAGLLDADAPAESTRGLLGSLPYMAPEQRRGRAEAASDVYAAAVTLAWLVSGELPGDLYVEAVIAALRERLGASATLAELLARAGAHAPGDRPSAAALRDQLRAFAGDAQVRLGPVTRTSAPTSQRGRWVRVEGPTTGARRAPGAIFFAGILALLALTTVGVGALWAMSSLAASAPPQDSPAVAQLRAYEALPVCGDMPTRVDEQIYPRWASAEPGGREASAGRIVDIDGDGRRDLLFGHAIDEEFRIFWGTGSRFDETPQRVKAMRMAQAWNPIVDAADVDGDGQRDLVGVSPESMSFVVVRGRGGRTFDAPLRVDTGGVPASLRTADWDGDGRADLVYTVADDGRGRGMWRRSLGEGRFDAERRLSDVVDAIDVLTDTSDKATALLVVSGGHLLRYPVLPDARRAADPDLDVAVPLKDIRFVRGLARSNAAYLWNPTDAPGGLRVSLADGAVCRYKLGAAIFDVGFFDDDALIDATSTRTCNYCTSSYQLLLGAK